MSGRGSRKRRPDPKRKPGERYDTPSYRQAIQRACDRAFPPPPDLDPDELRAWRKRHRWSPNQLRHRRSTTVGERYGLQAAQVLLGHRSVRTTENYVHHGGKAIHDLVKRIG